MKRFENKQPSRKLANRNKKHLVKIQINILSSKNEILILRIKTIKKYLKKEEENEKAIEKVISPRALNFYLPQNVQFFWLCKYQ